MKFAPHSLKIVGSVLPCCTPSWYCAFAHSLHEASKGVEARKMLNRISPGLAVVVVVLFAFVSAVSVSFPFLKASTVQNVFSTVLWMNRVRGLG
jgi:hypothetical protein